MLIVLVVVRKFSISISVVAHFNAITIDLITALVL